MRRTRTTTRHRPFAFLMLVAATVLAATGHPWWVLFAMWFGTFELRVTR